MQERWKRDTLKRKKEKKKKQGREAKDLALTEVKTVVIRSDPRRSSKPKELPLAPMNRERVSMKTIHMASEKEEVPSLTISGNNDVVPLPANLTKAESYESKSELLSERGAIRYVQGRESFSFICRPRSEDFIVFVC